MILSITTGGLDTMIAKPEGAEHSQYSPVLSESFEIGGQDRIGGQIVRPYTPATSNFACGYSKKKKQ